MTMRSEGRRRTTQHVQWPWRLVLRAEEGGLCMMELEWQTGTGPAGAIQDFRLHLKAHWIVFSRSMF